MEEIGLQKEEKIKWRRWNWKRKRTWDRGDGMGLEEEEDMGLGR